MAISACFGISSATAEEPKPTLPPAAERAIVFQKDIVPIVHGSCIKCHSGNEPKGALSLETRKGLFKGGESGPVVIERKSAESRLIKLVSGLEPDAIMPAQGPRLTKEQIGVLRAWIDQGAPWDEGFRFRGVQQAAIEPRRPDLPPAPPAAPETNPIDLLVLSYFVDERFNPGPVVSDAVFARRVSLDLVGLVPSPERLAEFEKDGRSDKRQRFVQELLADKRAYADHWLTFWNDALRNAYRGTGFIDGGRKQITDWLYRSLYENKPYDRFVHELISPTPESDGFISGIIWRGTVNASQRREMQAAQNVAQIFMGTNLKCASCHDSFVNHWKLADSYSLAAVFADGSLEVHRCDKATGAQATAGFIYPQLGEIDPRAPKAARMKQLADLMTGPKNGRLARTIVNRLWAWQMGRGLVEPLDDLDQPPWSQDLLDWLAVDLVDHKYDLKHTLELICTSRAYQLSAVGAPRPDESSFVFRGPIVKRMTAEQFVDAVSAVTGVWELKAIAKPREASGPADEDHKFTKLDGGIRTSLVNDDPLTRALGRPNREQVITRRDTLATTLQALELTNGDTLDGVLKRGAKNWAARKATAPDELIEQIYLKGLSRKPTDAERRAARDMLGSEPKAEGLEDLLWIVTMLPEFQLVY